MNYSIHDLAHGAKADVREGTLLLVDDEENILAALQRVLRREPYAVLTATSGAEGLALLAAHQVDVVISDQRMPGMTGTDFLRRVKEAYPETVRIVLSGYTELKSVTEAINEGAIYKFLTKPWDDDHLRANVTEAFRHKALEDENRRLAAALARSNAELERANARLKENPALTERELLIDGAALEVVREVVQALPMPVVGIDEDGMIVFVNEEAEGLLGSQYPLLSAMYEDALSPELRGIVAEGGTSCRPVEIGGWRFLAKTRPMGRRSRSIGRLLVLVPEARDVTV